jgi:tripartite-type tricarboxylate transporter receptor subunit TctC
VQSVVSGTTEIGTTALASGHAQIKGGLVRAIAFTGAERWFDLPDVPTMQEIGYPDFISDTFQGFFAPAGTPSAIIDRLARETVPIMMQPEIQERLRAAGFAVRPMGASGLADRVAREVPRWRDLIERAGIERQ